MSDRIRYRDLHPEKFDTDDSSSVSARRYRSRENTQVSGSSRYARGQSYSSRSSGPSASRRTGADTASGTMYRRTGSSSGTYSRQARYNSYDEDLYDSNRRGTRGKRSKKSKSYHFGLIIGILVPLFIIAAVVVWVLSIKASWAADEAGGGDRSTEEVVITIEEGSTGEDIADLLKDKGIIESSYHFYNYAKNNNYASSFQIGDFTVTEAMSYKELCTVLTTTTVRTDYATVTFPEGWTVMQMAERLEENGICGAEDFINTLETTDSFGFDFESEIVRSDLRIFKYEGYLLPATYDFYLDSSPTEVVEKMFTAFEALYDEYKDEIAVSGYSLDEIVVLASVIQRESFDDENMRMVSSVFHNRLDIGMALQSDATRDFLNTYDEYEISYTSEQADAYDTYQINGLPVGPINNPGRAAIIAALEPDDTPYYYFVTDPEGNYYFSETYDEHIAVQTW